MAFVVAVTICIIAWKPLCYLVFYYFSLCAATGFIIAWLVGQRMRDEGPLDRDDDPPWLSTAALPLLVPGLLILAYTLWVRHRWIMMPDDALIAFPSDFPDGPLMAIHAWLDKRNPAPDGMLKIHGERPIVQLIVEMAAQSIFVILGLLLGVTSYRSGPIGLEAWRRRFIRMHRMVVELYRKTT